MSARVLTFDMPCIDHGQERSGTTRLYGTAYALTEAGSRRVKAHRLAFEAYHGYRPEVVMHDCDNPRCINVAHLSPGTHALNNKDRARKGRSAKHLHAKRKLTDDQVRDIRATLPRDGVAAVARRHGVDCNVVYQVASNRTYKDVI